MLNLIKLRDLIKYPFFRYVEMRQIRNKKRKKFLYPPFSPGAKQQIQTHHLRISSVVLYQCATADQLTLPNVKLNQIERLDKNIHFLGM
jgi:hypothetical protein